MVSLDQVFLLEQKVESAVAKIQQLQAENDALRTKCDQLTNALSAKSEQLSVFENDQSQIENGIKKALERLNSIENSVLKAAAQANSNVQVKTTFTEPEQKVVQTSTVNNSFNSIQENPQIITKVPVNQQIPQEVTPSFETMEPSVSPDEQFNSASFFDQPSEEEDSTDGLGFDIF